jgi:PAS domain S-box-containing protein
MSNIAWLFALFILFCGLTHLASAVALYRPIYETQAAIKVMTAVISLTTAFVMFPLIPKALAIPTPEDLQKVIAQLQAEVESHLQTSAALRAARDELQIRVHEQLNALARASAVIAAIDESATVLMYAKTKDGKLIMANPAAIAAIGRPAEEIIGKTESDFLGDKEEIAKIQAVDREVCKSGWPVRAVETITRPDGSQRVYLSTRVPVRTEDGAIDGIVGVSVDVSEREALLQKLTRSEELFRLGSEAARFGSCEFLTDDRTLHVSPSLKHLLGLPHESASIEDFLEVVREQDRPAVEAALHTETSAEIEFRGRGGDEAGWFLLRGQHRPSDGRGRFIGAIVDISRRKRAEYRTGDLMRELIHRGRNLLTVVQVLARNSLIPPRTLAEAREIFIDRLHAFARGYELFVDGDHVGLTLKDLLVAETNRFPGQFRLEGPEFLLNERAAQSLGLVVHELTTNAAKYGALSKAEGCIHLTWNISDDGMLQFAWAEMSGPLATAPVKRGFGTGLIERILRADFGAAAHWEYAPRGYNFTFTAPLAKLRAASVGQAVATSDPVKL